MAKTPGMHNALAVRLRTASALRRAPRRVPAYCSRTAVGFDASLRDASVVVLLFCNDGAVAARFRSPSAEAVPVTAANGSSPTGVTPRTPGRVPGGLITPDGSSASGRLRVTRLRGSPILDRPTPSEEFGIRTGTSTCPVENATIKNCTLSGFGGGSTSRTRQGSSSRTAFHRQRLLKRSRMNRIRDRHRELDRRDRPSQPRLRERQRGDSPQHVNRHPDRGQPCLVTAFEQIT